MIDFETLAEKRAKELSQPEKEWVDAVMQPSFDEFSTYLSDGELEEFVFCFEYPVALVVVSGIFLKAHREGVESPYFDFAEMVNGSSLGLSMGLDFIYHLDQWERAHNRTLSFKAKLDALKNYLADNSRKPKNLDFTKWIHD